jgi:hypothetical protein
MIVAIGFNTIASLTAIGLWVASPCRSGPGQCAPAASDTGNAARPAALTPPPPRRPRISQLPVPSSYGPPADGEVAPDEQAPPSGNPIDRSTKSAVSPSPSLVALAESIHLNPQAIADALADEKGEISNSQAQRLERSFKTATALADRLSLNESQTQSLQALITYYVFSLLREEKRASPGSVDPATLEQQKSALINDIRATCGPDVASAAERVIEGL